METELTALKPERRTSTAKLDKQLLKLRGTALDALEELLTDETVKASDRLSAVKLTFELAARAQESPMHEPGEAIHVFFDNGKREWAE
jgi:hypothetical protein